MWQQKFDHGLQMPYYVNQNDGTVTFDLPCEVNQKKSPKLKENILHKITSALSLKRLCLKNSDEGLSSRCSRDSQSDNGYITAETSLHSTTPISEEINEPSLPLAMAHTQSDSYISPMPADSYMLEKAFNLHPHDNDVISLSSSESIQSFYLNIVATEVFYDRERSVYCDEKLLREENYETKLANTFINDDYERELERQELRQQILEELY